MNAMAEPNEPDQNNRIDNLQSEINEQIVNLDE